MQAANPRPASSNTGTAFDQCFKAPIIIRSSLVVAFFASYATLHLVQRISTLKSGTFRNWWLIGGAGAMGVGIWSMHFVGMLAFSLPIALGYDARITLLSLVIAVLVAHFALRQVTRDTLSTSHLVKSGILMGFGITMMHYVGMHAMRMHPSIEYDAGLIVLSFLVAVGASTAAMWIAFTLRTRSGKFGWLLHLAAALVMGLAITGMHYIGMAAANFPLGSICGAANGIDAKWLSVTVVLATLGILTIALMLSVLDARLELRTNLFNRSLENANERLQYQAMHDAAIDDFGTGYSSLSHLQQFSVSQIKVDRMFVKDLSETNIKGRSMVAAIIGLAHSMGMVVVAEGVETLSQAAILREMSCDQFQGFLFAKPLPLEDFVALLSDEKALAA